MILSAGGKASDPIPVRNACKHVAVDMLSRPSLTGYSIAAEGYALHRRWIFRAEADNVHHISAGIPTIKMVNPSR